MRGVCGLINMLFAKLAAVAVLLTTTAFLDEASAAAVNKDSLLGRHLVFRSGNTASGDKSVIAENGDTIELQCELLVSEWSNAQWLIHQDNDREETVPVPSHLISSKDSLSILTLKNVTGDERGNYSCVLISFGSSQTFKYEVTIKDELACNEETCQSNGKCLEVVNGYLCECKTGYIGTNCEFKDPCLDFPCQNGGTCVASGAEFTCRCRTGFGGDTCDSEVCTPNYCRSSGTCSVKNKKKHCTCNYNHAGDLCQHQCSMRTYNGYGRTTVYCSFSRKTCKISSNVLYGRRRENCVCDSNRPSGGDRCMMESDVRNECNDHNICNGHGSCTDSVFGYRCNCYTNYHGTNCEFYNECGRSSNLCNTYGGRCVDLTDGYRCSNCPDGQSGDKCQYKKDPCKVTCHGRSMTAECDTRFMNTKMKVVSIHLNSKSDRCSLPRASGYYRRITVDYTGCGTETEYVEDYVIYRNHLSSGITESGTTQEGSDSIISRNVGHFSFKMECSLPLVRNASKGLADLSLRSNETMDLLDKENIDISRTNIEFYKEDYSTRISNYVVGDRLYVKMTISTDSNPTLSRGYKLYPISCFATPGRDATDENGKYTLLDDGCIVDSTFRFENASLYRSDERRAFFSFDSFSFKSYPGKLYLHCTSLACVSTKSENECGVTCDKVDNPVESQTTISPRFKRNETIATSNQDSVIDRQPGSSVNIFTTAASPSNLDQA